MTIKQMEYILELARTRNFNRAAENLYITQPALTYQIQRAEEEIGFTLFIRSGRGAALTIAGEEFTKAIENILGEYSQAVSAGQKLDPLFSAAITIALPELFAIPHLAEAIESWQEDFPKVPINARYYGDANQTDIPDADIIFAPKPHRSSKRKGWKEHFSVTGYNGTKTVPKLSGDEILQEEDTIWIPFSADRVDVSVLVKNDEEREDVHSFLERFKEGI